MIRITPTLCLDDSEVEETFVRATGPGGQHVNKTSSAVQLRFDARRSRSLPADVVERLLELAGQRATQDGVIIIVAQNHRSQRLNRDEAMSRLVTLIGRAAVRPKARVATRPTLGSRRRRLEGKRQRSETKAMRGRVD